jgi:hypothetical protein
MEDLAVALIAVGALGSVTITLALLALKARVR